MFPCCDFNFTLKSIPSPVWRLMAPRKEMFDVTVMFIPLSVHQQQLPG